MWLYSVSHLITISTKKCILFKNFVALFHMMNMCIWIKSSKDNKRITNSNEKFQDSISLMHHFNSNGNLGDLRKVHDPVKIWTCNAWYVGHQRRPQGLCFFVVFHFLFTLYIVSDCFNFFQHIACFIIFLSFFLHALET